MQKSKHNQIPSIANIPSSTSEGMAWMMDISYSIPQTLRGIQNKTKTETKKCVRKDLIYLSSETGLGLHSGATDWVPDL